MPRGGPRPNSGGARPGAGRKSAETVDYQASMRQVIKDTVTREDWQKVTMVALAHAKAGEAKARDWLSAWVVGAPPKEPTQVELTQKGDAHEKVKGKPAKDLLALLEKLGLDGDE